jgi:hypothetical protein
MCDENNEQQTLASAPGLGSITLCPCGTITLHLGGVSVRLDPHAFAQTAGMCRDALEALTSQARTQQYNRTRTLSQMTH